MAAIGGRQPGRADQSAAPDQGDATGGGRVARGSGSVMAKSGVSMDESPRRLDAILRALPEMELKNLIARMGIRIDSAKRIDTPSQAARALVGIPDVRDPSRLPNASRELLHRIAEGGGVLVVPSLPAGLEPLIARGVVYARKTDEGI